MDCTCGDKNWDHTTNKNLISSRKEFLAASLPTFKRDFTFLWVRCTTSLPISFRLRGPVHSLINILLSTLLSSPCNISLFRFEYIICASVLHLDLNQHVDSIVWLTIHKYHFLEKTYFLICFIHLRYLIIVRIPFWIGWICLCTVFKKRSYKRVLEMNYAIDHIQIWTHNACCMCENWI